MLTLIKNKINKNILPSFFLKPPFYSRDTNEMYNNILHKTLRFNQEISASQAARSIITEVDIKN